MPPEVVIPPVTTAPIGTTVPAVLTVPVVPPATGETPEPIEDDGKEDISKLPSWAQKRIGALNAEARDRRKTAQEAIDAKKVLEDQALADKEQWKVLAEQRQVEIATLKTKAGQTDELADLLTKQINAEIADWPEEVKSMAPEGEVSALTLLTWVEKARPLAAKMKQSQSATVVPPVVPGGNGRGPKPIAQAQGRGGQPLNDEPLVDAKRRF